MKKMVRSGRVAVVAALLMGCAVAAHAQDPGGAPPPPPGGGFGGPGGPGGQGGFGGPGQGGPGFSGGMGRGMRQATIVDVPASALASSLKLSSTQTEKITAIEKQLQKTREENRPQFGGPGGRGGFGGPGGGQGGPPPGGQGGQAGQGAGQQGTPPDFEAMRAQMDKMRTAEQTAVRDAEAVLTDEQKKALPGVLAEMNSLRAAGIPLEVVDDLKLTADQKTKISDITKKSQEQMQKRMETARQSGDFQNMRDTMMKSQQQTRTQVLAVLTETQRATVKAFVAAHPQPQGFGGRGGFGGPGGGPPGGFGGPGAGGPPPGGPEF